MTSLLATVRTTKPAVSTRVLFDSAKPRLCPTLFGIDPIRGNDISSAADIGERLEALQARRLAESAAAVEPALSVASQAALDFGALEAGRRAGRLGLDPQRVRFCGWPTSSIEAYWRGYAEGFRDEQERRLTDLAELDARFDAMYADRFADWHEDEIARTRS